MLKNIVQLAKSLNIFEIVMTTVVSVAIGVAFWGWTYVYEIAKPFLQIFGLKYLVSGFWIFSSIFLSYLIRRPGIALLASLISAFIEGLISQWGIMSLLWGLVQGMGAELIFLLFLYKKWDWKVLTLAALSSAFFSYTLDYFYYPYTGLAFSLNLVQLISFQISAVIFGSFLSYWVAKKLLKTGLLNNFLIAKENV